MNAPGLERGALVSSGLPVGLALGAAIWLLSASITGRPEPWDAPGVYYPAALLAAGAIGGALVPGHWGEVAVGVFTGQALVLMARVMTEPGNGSLWLLGLLFLALYSLLALLGAGLGSGLRRMAGRASGRSP